MWASIFTAITKAFNSITWFFTGLESFMKAFSEVGTMTHETSILMSQEANIKRQAAKTKLLAEYNVADVVPAP